MDLFFDFVQIFQKLLIILSQKEGEKKKMSEREEKIERGERERDRKRESEIDR